MHNVENQDEWVSKTRKKKQMDELQDLGMELTRLSASTLKKIALPEDLHEAIKEYQKITSNSAVKRQRQYIGRLMRDVDPEPIRTFLAKLKGENRAHNGSLRTLIRNARKEAEQNKPPKNFRALYQEVKWVMDAENNAPDIEDLEE